MALGRAGTLPLLSAVVLGSLLHFNGAGAKENAVAASNNPIASYPAQKNTAGGWQGQIPISYRPETWRTGWYYLPADYDKRILPVLVMFHGSGMNGYDMLNVLRRPADKFKFAVIAPESHNSLFWYDSKPGQPFTSDWDHAESCFQYVQGLSGVRFNRRKIAYGGFSRGGYAAGALATRVGRATHALIFHSSVHPNEMGRNIVPMWFSSGKQDPIFPASKVLRAVKTLKAKKPQLYGHVKTKFFTGRHQIRNKFEVDSAVDWWFRN